MAHWLDDEGKELFQTGAYVPKEKGKSVDHFFNVRCQGTYAL